MWVSFTTWDLKHCWCASVQSMSDPTLLPSNMVCDIKHPTHLYFRGSDTIYSGRTRLGCGLRDGSCWGELRKVIGNIKGEYEVGGPRSMLVCGSGMASYGGRSTKGLWGSTTGLSEIVEGTGGPRPRKPSDINWGWPNSLLKALWCMHWAGECSDWAKWAFTDCQMWLGWRLHPFKWLSSIGVADTYQPHYGSFWPMAYTISEP